MIQTLIKNWWLLAVCGVLYATMSVIYLIIQDRDGPMTLVRWGGTGAFLGIVTLAAGACSIATGMWRSAKGNCWLLVLNGLALGALGLIYVYLARYAISFRTVALLFVAMAISIGILELVTARRMRRERHLADEWFFDAAGAASVGFALAFLALGFGWIKIDPWSHFRRLADFMWWKADFLWFGFYFGFSAICMLGLALRLNNLRAAIHGVAGSPVPIR